MLVFVIILIIVAIQLSSFKVKGIETSLNIPSIRTINAAVLLYSSDDIFFSLVQKSLEDIQKANSDKIQFTFFYGKANSAIQFENINKSIESDFDLVVLNMIEGREEVTEDIFIRFKQKNVPVLLLASNIPEINAFSTYNKAFILSSDPTEAGWAQGKLIADTWNANKGTMDRNKDNIMQYIMLEGRRGSIYSDSRTKASIQAINNSGISIEELAAAPADWNKELAKNAISSLYLRYGNDIEVIIANNDAMAIGAIEALQQYGYNMGGKSKLIPVFGIDAIVEGKELIKKGYMAGSVFQNPVDVANAIYVVGQNLISDKFPTEGTNYKMRGKEIVIPLVYEPYTINSK
jgi:methyl-galactoside transport system substrate-binding protein